MSNLSGPRFGANPRGLLRLALGLLLVALFASGPIQAADGPPRVVVSIKPLHSLLAGLMEGVGEPTLLIEGEGPPWDFVAERRHRQALLDANLVVWVGPELETTLGPLLSVLDRGTYIYEALSSEALKILPARHDDSQRDPFFWLDSRNMLILLDEMADLLIRRDPTRSLAYERNRQKMVESLIAVDRMMEFRYRDVSGVPVFVYHDTLQYFEQAYAMRVAGRVSAIAGTAESDTARLLDVRSGMRQVGRSCLFVERALPEPHVDLLLADGGIKRVEIDSFGNGLQPGPDLYVQLMRDTFAAISDCVRSLKSQDEVQPAAAPTPDMTQSPARFAPRYAMLDQHGRAVASEDFGGRLQLIYFGYTYCPDICPTSLAVMAQALRRLGDEAEQIQPIFITVDPQRDTPELLAEYVRYFHPRMLGLSASLEATKRTAELFRARYEFVPAENGDPERYVVDHTASLYLLGRNGEFITKFAHGLPADEVAERLRGYLRD